MKKLLTNLLPLAAAGCVAVPYYPQSTYRPAPTYVPPPQPQVVQTWYSGQHPIPDAQGGGWCYVDTPHQHDWRPDRDDWYGLDRGYLVYRGPSTFSYVDGHPLPGGRWCMIRGRHTHEFVAPHDNDWEWVRGGGFRYRGAYTLQRPPPPSYWSLPGRPVDVRPPPPAYPPDDRRYVPPPPVESPQERAAREREERKRAR